MLGTANMTNSVRTSFPASGGFGWDGRGSGPATGGGFGWDTAAA